MELFVKGPRDKPMRRLFVPLLSILPLFFTPVQGMGADAKPKVPATDPATGDKAREQPTADQAPADPKTDDDADKQGDADQADADIPKPRKFGARPNSIAVTAEPGGLKTLTIHFHWELFPNGSVEVRLVPNSDLKKATVTPVYFAELLKDKVREELYKCLDHPGEGGRTYSFTKDKLVYKMIGRRNSLGNQGVHVYVAPEGGDTPRSAQKAPPPGAHVQARPHNSLEDMEKVDPNPGTVYLQLDTWAVDRDTLSLDMERDEFAKPGTLFVWFFRGNQTVWEEQIRWPGYK